MSSAESSVPRRFQIVEQFTQGRSAVPAACEDVLLVTDDFVAVFDGTTDKAGVDYFSMSSGRFAAMVLADAVRALPAGATFPEAVYRLSGHLNAAIHAALPMGVELHDRPSASGVIYSAARHEVWRLGDLHFAVDDQMYVGGKVIDEVTSHARAAYLQVLLADGHGREELAVNDPGRALILPLLELQHHLRNAEGSRYAYGAFDGLQVPDRFIEVLPLPEHTSTLIIATDGYLLPAGTLDLAEQHLRDSLGEDPLRVGVFASTKGLKPGQTSFDDRTYIRLHFPPAPSVEPSSEPK